MPKFTGWICSAPIFQFEGWLFRFSEHIAPWPLTKDFSARKRAGNRFYTMFDSFSKLSEKKQTKYRIGGGCERF